MPLTIGSFFTIRYQHNATIQTNSLTVKGTMTTFMSHFFTEASHLLWILNDTTAHFNNDLMAKMLKKELAMTADAEGVLR